ncbi:hypothetical protein NEMIN01_1758 [Nematocida minor]|uniref:uncharacterized protein n=1 Tax=Nematocida minor TaxID=1912983 RepID=UPI00221F97DA|nr:uncharacterized protein NEMIN01_1758 [Nematocida minor]KAI5191974.1 hypothetical protein NEMIN01_1758 [Nematocida minor]
MDGIKALYTLLERNEMDERLLQPEEIEYVKKSLAILGYKLNKWHDARTLVVTANDTANEIEGAITEYEVASLDILASVASRKKGIPAEELINCTITADLLKKRWLIVEDGRIRLSKRTKIEKADILSEKTDTEICSFCDILNEEGNVPHEECLQFITNKRTE